MSKSKNTTTTVAAAPIVAAVAETASIAKTYTMRLPKETADRPQTYIVPQGPMGVNRWLAKKSYAVSKDADGLYVVLTQSQADYYFKTLPADCAYMPVENKA